VTNSSPSRNSFPSQNLHQEPQNQSELEVLEEVVVDQCEEGEEGEEVLLVAEVDSVLVDEVVEVVVVGFREVVEVLHPEDEVHQEGVFRGDVVEYSRKNCLYFRYAAFLRYFVGLAGMR